MNEKITCNNLICYTEKLQSEQRITLLESHTPHNFVRKEMFDQMVEKVKQLEDKLSQPLIEKQIFERASLDGDNRIDELKAHIKELEKK